MKLLIAILLAFCLGLGTVGAEWWDNPPPPPNADNTDQWPAEAEALFGCKNQDSGPSIEEVYLSKIEQEAYWLWT